MKGARGVLPFAFPALALLRHLLKDRLAAAAGAVHLQGRGRGRRASPPPSGQLSPPSTLDHRSGGFLPHPDPPAGSSKPRKGASHLPDDTVDEAGQGRAGLGQESVVS